VVKDSGKQFEFFAAIFIVNGIIDDKNFTFIALSQSPAKGDGFFSNGSKKISPVMIRRIEESVSGVTGKGNGRVIRYGKAPEITKPKDGKEKGLKNIENAKSANFEFATVREDIFERDKFAEEKKHRNILDILVFLI
jgi:hypothetical protein